MKLQVRDGDIFVFNAVNGGWFSKAQRFFTRKPYTHSSIGMYECLGLPSVLEAYLCVTVTPVKNWEFDENMQFWQYRLKQSYQPYENGYGTVRRLYEEFAGNDYGFAQLLFFVYRWIGETFGKDMRKVWNPFQSGTICSELVWVRLYRWATSLKVATGDTLPLCLIDGWNRDSFHAGDVQEVMQRLHFYFDLVECRK